MAAQTGRTTFKYVNFQCDDSGSTLRTIPINGLSVVGLVYDEVTDVIAWQDAVKSALPGQPDAPIEISGPFDNSAAAAAGTLSGSHTVLSAIVGLMTPLTLDVQFGIRQAYTAGEPQFGITATAANGYICTSYTVDPATMTYSARFVLYPGSAAPAWGTAAET